jgi:3-deoxy-D-manno-octulosonate 8-phosphate phosphatase KdsC-like HAD superfamily phosphatase
MDYCENNNFDLQNVAYMGNDLNDKDAMIMAGVTFCPADAYDSIKAISDHVLKTKGGHGVVRELFGLISRKKGE